MSAANVVRLVLDDAERGARLTPALVQRLRSQLAGDPARLVVIEGSGGSFCTGLDLHSVGREVESPGGGSVSVEATLGSFRQLLHELRATPRPVIAVVDGPAMGGGVGLAAAADLVLASGRATFSLPETLFGLIPAVIFPFLAERVGVGRARAMAIGGETVGADRAAACGLVDQVSDDLPADTDRLLRRLLRQDASAHAHVKRLVNQHFGHPDAYAPAAMAAFSSLLESESTRTRLARYAAGGNPWPE